MTTPTAPDDRAARLAALRAARDAASAATPSAATPSAETSDPALPPPPATAPAAAPPSSRGHRPARAAKVATVGLSTTAVLGLMAGYGAIDAAAAEPVDPVGQATDDTARPEVGPGTIRVAADAEAIVLVVDADGRPIDLVHLPTVTDLKTFLENATPIIPSPAVTIAAQEVTSPATADAPTSAVLASPSAAPAPSTGANDETTTAPTPTPAPAPAAVVTPEPAPSPTPEPAPAPVSTPAPVPTAVPAPETSAPIAQPAPVELAIPLPTPAPSGNTAGS